MRSSRGANRGIEVVGVLDRVELDAEGRLILTLGNIRDKRFAFAVARVLKEREGFVVRVCVR